MTDWMYHTWLDETDVEDALEAGSVQDLLQVAPHANEDQLAQIAAMLRNFEAPGQWNETTDDELENAVRAWLCAYREGELDYE